MLQDSGADEGSSSDTEAASDDELFEEWVREDGVLLYEYAVGSDENYCDDSDFDAQSELRARDIDHDREVELTVIAAVAGTRPRRSSVSECGSVAFIVGGRDLEVQARFTREFHQEKSDAGGEVQLGFETRWRLGDQDHDGHPDLHVIESFRFRSDFEGDYIGGGETASAEHERNSGRRAVDCPYDQELDRWLCPASPALGVQLFRPLDQIIDTTDRGVAPPAW